MEVSVPFNLVVTIVNRGRSEEIIEASRSAGAEGGTIIPGRGTGIRECAKLWGIPIEPEKEIVLTIVPRDKTDAIVQAIVQASGLDQPGSGIAFVVGLDRVLGICHLCGQQDESAP